MADIFISYSKSSRDTTVALASHLENRGYSVWWDTSLRPGEVFREVIDRELDAASAVIVIWTEHSVKSRWVIAEADHADHQGKLITVRTEDISIRTIPKPYNTNHTELVTNHAAIESALHHLGIGFSTTQNVNPAPVSKPKSSIYPEPGSGQSFRDAPHSPELVIIPPGTFLMGSAEGLGEDRERPRHKVSINYPLAVGRFAVTFDEWDHYASKQSGAHKPEDHGWGRGNRPVIDVNWDNAKAYVKWLSETTGHTYRLLSESEWEYACRAGTSTEYWWGDQISHDLANYDFKLGRTVPVDSFEPNPWGLYNVHGNVWEWCEDWWHENYTNAPTDGSSWLEAGGGDSSARVLRGGSWYDIPMWLRARVRSGSYRFSRDYNSGFRVARAL